MLVVLCLHSHRHRPRLEHLHHLFRGHLTAQIIVIFAGGGLTDRPLIDILFADPVRMRGHRHPRRVPDQIPLIAKVIERRGIVRANDKEPLIEVTARHMLVAQEDEGKRVQQLLGQLPRHVKGSGRQLEAQIIGAVGEQDMHAGHLPGRLLTGPQGLQEQLLTELVGHEPGRAVADLGVMVRDVGEEHLGGGFAAGGTHRDQFEGGSDVEAIGDVMVGGQDVVELAGEGDRIGDNIFWVAVFVEQVAAADSYVVGGRLQQFAEDKPGFHFTSARGFRREMSFSGQAEMNVRGDQNLHTIPLQSYWNLISLRMC